MAEIEALQAEIAALKAASVEKAHDTTRGNFAAVPAGGVTAMGAKAPSLAALAGPQAMMATKVDARGYTSGINQAQTAGLTWYRQYFKSNGTLKPENEGMLTPVQVKMGEYIYALSQLQKNAMAQMKGKTYNGADVYKYRMLVSELGTTSIFEMAEILAARSVEHSEKRGGLLTVMRAVDEQFTLGD